MCQAGTLNQTERTDALKERVATDVDGPGIERKKRANKRCKDAAEAVMRFNVSASIWAGNAGRDSQCLAEHSKHQPQRTSRVVAPHHPPALSSRTCHPSSDWDSGLKPSTLDEMTDFEDPLEPCREGFGRDFNRLENTS